MKKYAHTYHDTIKTFEGDNIEFDPRVLTNYVKKIHYERINQLTEEEKEKFFYMSYHYRLIMDELFDNKIDKFSEAGWQMEENSRARNPSEEYENYMSIPQDADLTDEEHNLKIDNLRQFKDWFEKQNF
jgi:hypothetical protein